MATTELGARPSLGAGSAPPDAEVTASRPRPTTHTAPAVIRHAVRHARRERTPPRSPVLTTTVSHVPTPSVSQSHPELGEFPIPPAAAGRTAIGIAATTTPS